MKDLRGQLTDTQSRTDNLRQQLSAAQQEAKAIDKKNKELKVQAKQLQQEVKSIGSRWFSRGRWTVIALQATIIAVYCLSCFIQGELEAARIRNA
ncbi:MAG: hypothetical protein LBF25_01315 [Puniceicoccales bacterium]|nr:hypothetical protein [Puniceicoccales bacterium]